MKFRWIIASLVGYLSALAGTITYLAYSPDIGSTDIPDADVVNSWLSILFQIINLGST
jgi:hypothetical protein